LFGCPIITWKPLTDLPQILIGQLGKATGMFLALFSDYKFSKFPNYSMYEGLILKTPKPLTTVASNFD